MMRPAIASLCLRNRHQMSWRCVATNIRFSLSEPGGAAGSVTTPGRPGAVVCGVVPVVPVGSWTELMMDASELLAGEPNSRIEPYEGEVGDQGSDDRHRAEQQHDAAREEHVLGLERRQQKRSDRGKAEDHRDDDRAGYHLWEKEADRACKGIHRHPDRIFQDRPA